MSAPSTHAHDYPLPSGYVPVLFSSLWAKQWLERQSQESRTPSLGQLERRYAEHTAHCKAIRRPSGAVARGAGQRHVALSALTLARLALLWKGQEVEWGQHEALRNAVADGAVERLFASSLLITPKGRCSTPSTLGFCLGEVLIAEAAQLDWQEPAGDYLKGLLKWFDQVRPQWRDEHTANWCAREVRAVQAPWLSDVGAVWGTTQRVCLDNAAVVGPVTAATFIHHSVRRVTNVSAPIWANAVQTLLANPPAPDTLAWDPDDPAEGAEGGTLPFRPLSERLDATLTVQPVPSGVCAVLVADWRHRLLAAQLPKPSRAVAPGPSL